MSSSATATASRSIWLGAVLRRLRAHSKSQTVPGADRLSVSTGPANVSPPGQRPNSPLSFWLVLLAGVVAVAAGCVYVPRMYFADTDDAFIQADTVSIVPKVAAHVVALHVTDNASVSAGQLLVELDPRDFQVAADAARADLQNAEAARTNLDYQIQEQGQIIDAAQAAVDGARAASHFAEQQLDRYGRLAQSGSGSTERWQQAQSDIGQRKAALRHDLASLAGAKAHADVLRSQAQQADAAIARQRTVLAQALLNLSYTKIVAPTAGTVANRTIQVGAYVQPGQALLAVVPDDVFIVANFKETQLANMVVGQRVIFTVDAIPGVHWHGHVESFQRGTGANFALLPPENASGNFIKVVQRVPVRIKLDEASRERGLWPGMSVEIKVETHAPPRWLAWLAK